jgi:signal peptidase I
MELENRSVRTQAVRRSWACPGAGFALLGRDALALSTYVTSLAALGAMIWLALKPGPLPLWTTVVLGVLSTALWIAEQLMIKRLISQPPRPRFLVNSFLVASAPMWIAAALALTLLFTRFGSIRLAGNGMSPTLENGERALYVKGVDPERLQRGTVIVFRTSRRSAWGEPGAIVTARILAVPGDRLSIRDGGYVLNGEHGPAVADTGSYAPVVAIPTAPDALTLSDNRFFVVQDSPKGGFDTRVLSWTEPTEIVSTRLYYLRGGRLLRSVE